MPKLAILFGLLLTALCAVSYFSPDLLGSSPPPANPDEPNAKSITALIPSFFGIALLLCGLLSVASPDLRKHAMHVAAMVSLLGVVGAVFRPISVAIKGGELNFAGAPLRAQIIMAVLSAFFLFLCIRSFIQARKAREAATLNPGS